MRIQIIFSFILISLQVVGQEFNSELYGFKLGQYRKVAKNEFGKPGKYGKFEDGFVYEAFLLKPDKSLYIVFEYAARDTNLIWSIQVSGSNDLTDIGFKNAKLGTDKIQTETLFGKPSSIEDIGEYGQKWVYDRTNFSLEINKNGKLSSIKILDNSNDQYPSPDLKKIPSFDIIQKRLNSASNADLSKLLCGDIEIYYKNRTYSFEKSLKTELTTDYSKIFSLIREISKDLSSVNTNNSDEYEENMRIAPGQDPKHVIKFKKGHLIKEIVLKYYGGQYLIYEINADSK